MSKNLDASKSKIEELEKENQLLQKILSFTYDWQTYRDTLGNLIYSSPAMERITGYRNEDYFNGTLTFRDLVHPDDIDIILNEQQRSLKGEIVHSIELRIIKADGSIITVEVSALPVFDKEGRLEGFRHSIRDITDRKISENKLKEYSDRLSEMNQNKDQFLSVIAHDLKSPFNTLLSLSDLLLSNIYKYDIEEIKTSLEYIHDSASKTFSLIDNLLLWSNSQLNRIPFNPSKFCLCDIAMEVLEGLMEEARSKNIKVMVTIPEKYVVNADINMIKTVLRNLLSNAIKFTFKNGSVRIAGKKLKGKMLVTISDNGTGIAKKDQVKIWKFSGDKSKEGTNGERGSGFGLLLCRDFIEKHKEHIWLESKPGRGSSFMFTLPFYDR